MSKASTAGVSKRAVSKASVSRRASKAAPSDEPARPVLRRPTRAELDAAHNTQVPDVIGPGLKVLFCGINPSLYSAAVGHHFARPGNRFWPAMHLAGFTPRLFVPGEDRSLLTLGYGVSNVVSRATATAEELAPEEYVVGGKQLVRKVKTYGPACVAFLGIGAYRQAFGERDAHVGEQARKVGGARVWVLPNPSGLNAHYQVADLARVYGELRRAVEASPPAPLHVRGEGSAATARKPRAG